LRSAEVQHIEMLEHVTAVPNTAPFVEGVVFSRGMVIPAVNLLARFGFPREPHTPRTRLIIVQSGQRTLALIVDAAREFRMLPANSISPVEENVAGIDGNYLRAVSTVNERLILLLNLDAVINFSSIAASQSSLPAANLKGINTSFQTSASLIA
jgi:purine-binding chemotaxis protein CheW